MFELAAGRWKTSCVVLSAYQVDEAVDWCLRHGWKAALTPSRVTDADGLSAGAGVFARSWLGVGLPRWGASEVTRHRAVAALVEAPGYRGLMVYAVHLQVGVGLTGTNLAVLAAVGDHIAAHDNMSIVGAI